MRDIFATTPAFFFFFFAPRHVMSMTRDVTPLMFEARRPLNDKNEACASGDAREAACAMIACSLFFASPPELGVAYATAARHFTISRCALR